MSDAAQNSHAVDRLIHEPTRYNIMALLYVVEKADFLFIKNHLDLTAGNLSAHVSKLEDAGYLKVEKGFVGKYPRTTLSLTTDGRVKFENYREKMRQTLENLPAVDPGEGDP